MDYKFDFKAFLMVCGFIGIICAIPGAIFIHALHGASHGDVSLGMAKGRPGIGLHLYGRSAWLFAWCFLASCVSFALGVIAAVIGRSGALGKLGVYGFVGFMVVGMLVMLLNEVEVPR
jgi:hypothetical protein